MNHNYFNIQWCHKGCEALITNSYIISPIASQLDLTKWQIKQFLESFCVLHFWFHVLFDTTETKDY